MGYSARRVPIVVLVEEPNFGDYYYLMSHGAQYYYQLSEGPEKISRAINWAATSSFA